MVKTATRAAEANGVLGHGLHQPFHTMFEDVFEDAALASPGAERTGHARAADQMARLAAREWRRPAMTELAMSRRLTMIEAINDALDVMMGRDPPW
jgi:hypothetical protein